MTEPDPQLAAALRRMATRLDEQAEARAGAAPAYATAEPCAADGRHRRSRPLVAVAAALVLVALTVALARRDTSDHSAVAQAPPATRILLTATGWGIDRYDEQREGSGVHAETTFVRADGVRVDLHERATDYNDEFMEGEPNATVLGEPAHVTDTADHRTFWRRGETDLELRGAMELGDAEWRALLDSLRLVDDQAWRGALPESVVLPEQRADVVRLVLTGVPLPQGFDVDALTGSITSYDRYQVGAAVLGPVVCAWLDQWDDATARVDTAAIQQAHQALATAPGWPFLREMDDEGDYPEAIREVSRKLDDPTSAGKEGGQPFDCSR